MYTCTLLHRIELIVLRWRALANASNCFITTGGHVWKIWSEKAEFLMQKCFIKIHISCDVRLGYICLVCIKDWCKLKIWGKREDLKMSNHLFSSCYVYSMPPLPAGNDIIQYGCSMSIWHSRALLWEAWFCYMMYNTWINLIRSACTQCL